MKTVRLIQEALQEDIGPGDITSQWFIPARAHGIACIYAKQKAVLSGIKVTASVFQKCGCKTIRFFKKDSDIVQPGECILKAKGALRVLLKAERTALNFVQHLSGVATLTAQYIAVITGTKAKILDTRKTIPGLRELEKQAVVHGGGTNHRLGLYDRILIKDNHLVAIKHSLLQLKKTLKKIRKKHPQIFVEIEADTLQQVADFANLEVDCILLDNMPPIKLKKAVEIVQGRCLTEASGGVRLDTIQAIAQSGVDFISVGALTHSAPAIDFNMEIEAIY